MRKLKKKVNERLRTTIMSLVFITHVTAVVVSITNPGGSNASAIVAPKLVCVAGSDLWGCRDIGRYSEAYKHHNTSSKTSSKLFI